MCMNNIINILLASWTRPGSNDRCRTVIDECTMQFISLLKTIHMICHFSNLHKSLVKYLQTHGLICIIIPTKSNALPHSHPLTHSQQPIFIGYPMPLGLVLPTQKRPNPPADHSSQLLPDRQALSANPMSTPTDRSSCQTS